MKEKKQKRTHRPTQAAASAVSHETRLAPTLPPIPTKTEQGIRLLAIEEILEALDAVKGIYFALQDDEVRAMAERLDVPPLYVNNCCDAAYLLTSDADVVAYVTWRQELDGGAVS